MKYMTFHSACSYAGVANMLAQYGIDTDDRTIALGMKLPFLFAREGETFLAGPMLQSAQWFNLYLHPIGFEMRESVIPHTEVPDYLRAQKTAMLGIRAGMQGKHAVVYVGSEGGKLYFLNNKWQQEDSPEQLVLTAGELLERIEDNCMVATLHPAAPAPAPVRERMEQSLTVLAENEMQIRQISMTDQPVAFLRGQLNSLFRPLLLDGITMLDLMGEQLLKERFAAIQRRLLMALRTDSPQVRLCDHIPLEELHTAAEEYKRRIQQELDLMKGKQNAF